MEEKECCKTTERSMEDKKALMARINRISGQLSGIKKMIEENKYCFDIIVQLTAVEKAVRSLSCELADHHLHSCIIRDIQNGQFESLDEVSNLIKKLN